MTFWVRILLVANVGVFFLTMANPQLMNLLAFRPSLILSRPWTLITYQFVHAGLFHILFNMWALFALGPAVESRLGSRSFVILYVVAGVAGAVLTMILDPFAQFISLVGASGAVFGILLAFAKLYPTAQLLMFGVFPMSARALVIGFTVLSLAGGFSRLGGNIGHFAHLGGFVGAWAWLRWLEYSSGSEKFKRKVYENVAPSVKTDSDLLSRIRRVDTSRLHELNRAEFERLVQKVESEGIRSLTLDERSFLDRFS